MYLTLWWYKKLYGEESLENIDDPNKVRNELTKLTRKFLTQTEEQFKKLLRVDKAKTLLDYIKEEIKKRYESNADKKN